MKETLYLFAALLIMTWSGACKEKPLNEPTYPVTIVVGHQTLSGEICTLPNPPSGTDVTLPGTIFGLRVGSLEYVLLCDSHWVWSSGQLVVEGVEYQVDDVVKITGTVSETQISKSYKYFEIEIEEIEQLAPTD